MIRRTHVCLIIFAAVLCCVTAAAETNAGGTVNINNADVEQLQLLPRVGPSLAGRIIEFRETNGEFESVDELVAVRGIGEKSLQSLMPYVSTEGKTTLTEKVRSPRPEKSQDQKS